ncbi:MAG: hypothetical protein PSV23_16095 [Brevundimonas sp.]|uniref:hypothetical protein n=1 Tax=Brevundimonas sp. TaxID=1871086 RepID=UPI002487F7AE|nr:hypothetical protein [Brevundimonas sp.]MDI1328315.1 hypothetical protein [Brevundimonas sp.]
MRRQKALLIGLSVLALVGCSGDAGDRYVVTANDDILVVLEDVVRGDGGALSTATVHYILAVPQPLEEGQTAGRHIQRMTYRSRFDCPQRTWGSISRSYTFEDGGTVSETESVTALQPAAPDSVAGQIIATVCDPATAQAARNHRSLERLEQRYRAAL